MGRNLVALVFLGFALSPGSVHAQRIIEVSAEGDCPTQEALAEAIESRFGAIAPSGEGWRVSTGPDPSGAGTRFVLRAPDGSVSLERRVTTTDCNALASAFAIIADAYFVDLGVRTPPEPARPPPARPPPPVPPPRPPVRAPATRPASWSIALVGGGDLGLMPTVVTGFGTLHAGYRPAGFPLAFHVLIGGLAPSDLPQEREDQRVERVWAVSARVVAALRLVRVPMVIDVTAGPALLAARVRAVDLPMEPGHTGYHPGVALALAGGLPLGGAFSIRAEVGATVWPLGERYYIDPGSTTVAKSPLLSLSAGAGVQWETNR